MNQISLLTSFFLSTLIVSPAMAITMGMQNFDDNSPASQITDNANLNSGNGRTFDGTGLSWSLSFNDTRSTGESGTVSLPDSGDLIGVTNNISAVGSYTSGNQGFSFDDTDGQLGLIFAPIGFDGYTNVELSLDYFISDTGYESNDSFLVQLGGQTILNFGETELENSPESFENLLVDVDALSLGSGSHSLEILVDTNSDAEQIFIDTITFEGDAIAVPFEFSPRLGLLLIGCGLVIGNLKHKKVKSKFNSLLRSSNYWRQQILSNT